MGEKNPFNAVDVGNDAVPTFVDIDFDGDMDCFVGSNAGNIQLFKNTGSPSNPIYKKQVPFCDFDQFFYFIVCITNSGSDLKPDGHLDVIVFNFV